MTDRKPMSTPCVRVCCVSPKTNWCEGCYRTLKEIATWGRMTPEERDLVTAALPDRKIRQEEIMGARQGFR